MNRAVSTAPLSLRLDVIGTCVSLSESHPRQKLYHRVVHEMFEGIANIDTSMDDTIVWGKTRERA